MGCINNDLPAKVNTCATEGVFPPVTPLVPTVLEGQSLYAAYNRLKALVENMSTTYNNVIDSCYAQLNNLLNVGKADGVFYGDSVVTTQTVLDGSGCNVTIIKVKGSDERGCPIRPTLKTSSPQATVTADAWDFGANNLAQILVPANNTPLGEALGVKYNGWRGDVIQGGEVIKAATSEEEDGFTVGITQTGLMKVYPNAGGAQPMISDNVVSACGVSGYLVQNRIVTGYITDVIRYNESQSRVGIGQTQDGSYLFISCDSAGDGGLTAQNFANYFINNGAVVAVELCESDNGATSEPTSICMLNEGQNTVGINKGQSGYANTAYWYITSADACTTDFYKEVIKMYYLVGKSLNDYNEASNSITGIDSTLSNHETRLVELQTASVNAATSIANLKQSVDNLETSMTNANNAIDAAEANIATLTENVQDIQMDISTIDENPNLEDWTAVAQTALTATENVGILTALNNFTFSALKKTDELQMVLPVSVPVGYSGSFSLSGYLTAAQGFQWNTATTKFAKCEIFYLDAGKYVSNLCEVTFGLGGSITITTPGFVPPMQAVITISCYK